MIFQLRKQKWNRKSCFKAYFVKSVVKNWRFWMLIRNVDWHLWVQINKPVVWSKKNLYHCSLRWLCWESEIKQLSAFSSVWHNCFIVGRDWCIAEWIQGIYCLSQGNGTQFWKCFLYLHYKTSPSISNRSGK